MNFKNRHKRVLFYDENFKNRQKNGDKNQICGCLWTEESLEEDGRDFLSDRALCILTMGVVTSVSTQRTVHLKNGCTLLYANYALTKEYCKKTSLAGQAKHHISYGPHWTKGYQFIS